MKKIVIPLLTILILFTVQIPILAQDRENGLYLRFELNFFNQNEDGALIQAFQRSHILTITNHINAWDISFTYNWLEKVDFEYSLHDMTPLGLAVNYKIDSKQDLRLTYIEVTDLYHLGRDSNVLRLDYDRQLFQRDPFDIELRASGRLINQNYFVPVLGGRIVLGQKYHLGINYLDPMDDHILDERDLDINFPVNIGAEFPINENVRLRIDVYSFLQQPADGYKTWVKTQLQFDLWKFQ